MTIMMCSENQQHFILYWLSATIWCIENVRFYLSIL